MSQDLPIARLNWGCGPHAPPGWINSDVRSLPGVHLACDIREGLPLRDASIDYAVAIHALQDLPFVDLDRALRELFRVLKDGGVLRLGLPDMDRAIAAYLRGDRGYFYVPDEDVRSIGGKLCVQVAWYGSNRTPFTFDLAAELLSRNGFRDVARCAFRETKSPWPDIVALDNRERESLFVEARR
jgi:predicted SAM-dependent methyltransferase